MKTFYTLLLTFGISAAFAQFAQPKFIENPNYVNHIGHFGQPESLTRGGAGAVCDSNDLLDYSSYTEVYSLLNGAAAASIYGFNELYPHPVYIQEITSFVTDASAANGDVTYAAMAFDTLAFQNFPDSAWALYGYPLASSTITLNGLIYAYQYYADTVASDSTIANDSLVFKVYAIDNTSGFGVIDSVLEGEAVISGDSLSSLYTGSGMFGFASIPINSITFNQGQGFFIKVEYLNKDTSSHFSLATTFVDSCGTAAYTYNGQPVDLIAAALSPLNTYVEDPIDSFDGFPQYGLTFFGAVLNGPIVYNENNTWGYQGIGLVPDPPFDCSFTTQQHFVLMPIINVCHAYTVQILANPVGSCPGGTVNLATLVTGSNLTTTVIPNTLAENGVPIGNNLHLAVGDNTLTYRWSASSGTLSDSTSATPTLTMPGSGNVTVTVNVNDGTNDTTATFVIINYPPVVLNITNSPQPVLLTCGGTVTLQLTATGTTGTPVYTWTGPGVDTSGQAITSLTVSLPGEYNVVVAGSAGCPASDSVKVIYANGINNTVTFTAPDSICIGASGSFVNTSSDITGWTALWTFGDGNTSTSLNSTSHSYATAGNYTTKLSMDSDGCTLLSPLVTVTVVPPPHVSVNASGPTTFCSGASVIFTATSGFQQYQWSISNASNTLTATTAGSYTVTVTDQHGCTAASTPEIVVVDTLPAVTLTLSPDTICSSTSSVTLNGGSPAGGTFSGQWITSGVFHSNLSGPGTYTINYSYTNSSNCTGTATANLIVNNCTGIEPIALDNIRVFPNPTGDVINIYNPGNEGLLADLTDVSGKKLMEGIAVAGTDETLNLSAYSSGVYLLRLHDKSGNERVVKVVKE